MHLFKERSLQAEAEALGQQGWKRRVGEDEVRDRERSKERDIKKGL